MTWSDRPTNWDKPGHPDKGGEKEAILDQIDSLTDPGWVDWTSSFFIDGSVTDPTQGNSTYLARYRRSAGSDLVIAAYYILIGSTFSAGSGTYRFPVPFVANTNSALTATSMAYIFDNGTANRHALCKFESGTQDFLALFTANSLNSIGNSGSGTAWATGDIMSWEIMYQAAS